MTNQRRFVAVAAVLMLSSAGVATAGESPSLTPEAAPARAVRHHSLNLGVEALAGAPSLVYEYLWADGRALMLQLHGVYRPRRSNSRVGIGGVIGMALEASGEAFQSYEVGSVGIGAVIGYRWHWRQQQGSGFHGVHVGYDLGTSIVDRTDIIWANHQTFYVAGHLGRRWLLRNDVNITARVGAGLAYRTRSEPFDAEYIPTVRYLDALLEQFPITVDGELSVGYTF